MLKKRRLSTFRILKITSARHYLCPKKIICWTPQELLEKIVKWKTKNICEKDGDQVWCIFDIDDFYKNDKNALIAAVKNATKNNIKIAYANECFELWILLHFQQPTSPIKKGKDIEERIKKIFKKHKLQTFIKNQKVFDVLLPFQNNAIQNAKNILSKYDNINWNEKMSEKGNPSTTIHFLVNEINTLIGNNEK